MKKINEIFYTGIHPVNENIIRTISIDWDMHSKGIFNIAKSLEPKFVVNENNKRILRLLLLYFTGSKDFTAFATELGIIEPSLNKGLMMVGGVGTGKSLLFDIFKKYTGQILRANSFRSYTSIAIIDDVNVNGVEYLELFNENFGYPITCYIDDIASKNEVVKHYGTEYNVIEQLLSIRYNIFSRYKKLTHVSSNKYPNEFKGLYDIRVIDRMKEMFNILELNCESFRI